MSRWIDRLAGSGDTPRRTAAAFALGVCLSFSPILGLQIITGMSLAFALGLSRPAVFIGLCANLPWIMVPWYTLTTAAGAYLLGVTIRSDFRDRLAAVLDLPVYRSAFWQRAFELMSPFAASFFVGSTIGALAVGAMTYVAMVPVIETIRRRQP